MILPVGRLDKRPEIDQDNALLCPNCGSMYLHHEAVQVFKRDREDGPGTVATITDLVLTQRANADVLPGRRDSLDIVFSCEECPRFPVLRIMQHKGRTLMEWRYRC